MRLSLLLLPLVLLLASPASATKDQSCTVDAAQRVDCWPEDYSQMTPATCVARGCCWSTTGNTNKKAVNGTMGQPDCFYPLHFGYTVVSSTKTATGVKATLQQRADSPAPYGGDVKTLSLIVEGLSDNIVHFKLTDANNARYEVPIDMPQTSLPPPSANPLYNISITNDPFGITITRASTGAVVFSNAGFGGLVFSDQFLQISSQLSSTNLYGLGEHVAPLLLNTQWQLLSLFSRDQGTPYGYTNLYGVHPYHINIEPSGAANGVFLLNSNAIDIVLQPTPAITYRTIGGVLDFYVFLGPTADNVITQYTSVVGRPIMPPYWGLGYHLCRWGYGSSQRTQQVVQALRDQGIPQDTQWNDIDYMNNHLDFTYDPKNFGTLPQLVQDLHAHDQHYIMIVDPGISNTQSPGSYAPYDQGLAQNAFVKNADGTVLNGSVWPGFTAFPDFLNPGTVSWWQQQISTFHAEVQFDGLWTDMNEPSNFVQGSATGCPSNSLENPPYVPNVADNMLRSKTLCMSAKHGKFTHYDVHSLYGYSEMVATMLSLQNVIGKRSMVISRSTFANSGAHGGHWLGDNNSNWSDMKASIAGILNFNIFGIPLVGADICGFGGDKSDAEMCVRWTQLGAFYPFTRNHNSIGKPDQDPTAFGPQAATMIRDVLLTRYSLLPYLYTLFYQASTQGTPVARALFFDSPTDKATLALDTQFMWGSGLLITPVLTQGAVSVDGYFPAGLWYDFYSGVGFTSSGQTRTLDAPLEKINLHIKAGAIIPTQQPATTTKKARTQPFGLTVALTAAGTASGVQFLDDGESLDTVSKNQYTLVGFNVQSSSLVSSVSVRGYTPSASLASISILGVAAAPSAVKLNGSPVAFSFNAQAQVLLVNGLQISLVTPFTLSWQ